MTTQLGTTQVPIWPAFAIHVPCSLFSGRPRERRDLVEVTQSLPDSQPRQGRKYEYLYATCRTVQGLRFKRPDKVKIFEARNPRSLIRELAIVKPGVVLI